jgi:alkaline phosphatase D
MSTMNRRAPTRRDVLRLTAASTAVAALGCGDNARFRAPGSRDASIVLEPEADSFLVVVTSTPDQSVAIDVRSDSDVVATASAVLDDAGHAVIAIGGLAPATAYQVSATASDGLRFGTHQVRTSPGDDDTRPVRLSVGADLDPSPEFDSDLLAQLIAAAPDLHVSIGDFPYTDNGPPANTVPEYRARHLELRTAPKVRPWLQSVGVRAIYDDHEFRNNWDASFVASEHDRYLAAMQVWDEFFPLLAAAPEIRYRSWRYGAQVECFLLDTRRFRSADAAPDDATKTMLGPVQRDWLIAGATASTATFKLVFTTVPLDFATGNDAWSSFTTERDALLDALASVPGLLFVSGDQHFFAAHRHAHDIREFQIGPLARGLGTPGPTAPGVLFRSVQYNFGLIDVAHEVLTFRGIAADGGVIYEESFTQAQLTPT